MRLYQATGLKVWMADDGDLNAKLAIASTEKSRLS
jgi:hypothetical protein